MLFLSEKNTANIWMLGALRSSLHTHSFCGLMFDFFAKKNWKFGMVIKYIMFNCPGSCKITPHQKLAHGIWTMVFHGFPSFWERIPWKSSFFWGSNSCRPSCKRWHTLRPCRLFQKKKRWKKTLRCYFACIMTSWCLEWRKRVGGYLKSI